MKWNFRFSRVLFLVSAVCLVGIFAFAQFPKMKIPKISGGNPFEKEAALTTSLADAVTETPFLDDFEPQDIAPLSLFPRGPENGFLIQRPGAYWFSAQSYCLRAGTHSPGKGNGYLYAPLKGSKAEIIRQVMRRSVSHPEIPQHDVQVLLWAILAQTKPSKMNPEITRTARILLTKKEIDDLEGSAFEEVSQDLFGRALGKLPPQTQRVFEAERQLRNAISGNVSYGELERIAVLAGEPLPAKEDRDVPSGRWSYQPEGYFIRYYPEGYQTTRTDVYYPEEIAIERDSLGRLKAIGRKDGKRIAVEYDETVPALPVDKEDAFKGFAFRSVRLEMTLPKYQRLRYQGDLGTAVFAEWRNAGWTFAGAFGGKGKPGAGDRRYAGAAARFDGAKRHGDELRKLLKNIEKIDKNKKIGVFTDAEMTNLLDLMQFSEALKELLRSQGVVRDDLFFDPVELTQRAWAFEFDVLVRSHGGSAVVEPNGPVSFGNLLAGLSPLDALMPNFASPLFNPDNGAASPGNTGRQRIGVSPRGNDEDDKCKEDFQSCQTDSGSAYMECFAACGANMPPRPTLGQLNEARKCFSACESSYSRENRKCASAAKKCSKG